MALVGDSSAQTASDSDDSEDQEESISRFTGGILSSVFTPYFLCSSPDCIALTSQVMDIARSIGSLDSGATEIVAFASNDWCPADATAGSSITQAFTIAGDVSSFDATKQDTFKQGIVDQVNSVTTADYYRITKANVALSISAGSVNVVATVATSSSALEDAVQSTMTTLAGSTSASLSTTLGVTVESVAAPTSLTIDATPATPVGGDNGGDSETGDSESGLPTAALIGIIAGAVVLVLVIIIVALVMCKKTAKAPQGVTVTATVPSSSKFESTVSDPEEKL